MKYVWLALAILLAACSGAPRPSADTAAPFDGPALYRAARMHELRDRLRERLLASGRAPDAAARDMILLARTYIDLRVVWDEGSFDEALAVLATAHPADAKLVAELEQVTGEVVFWRRMAAEQGTWDDVRARFERALELRTAAHDTRGIAESTFYLGLIAQFTGDAAEAQRLWERAVELGKGVDDPLMRSYPIRHLADFYETAGDLTRAEALHREALALREQAGDVLRLFNARVTLATFLCERRRDCAAAAPLLEAVRRTAQELRMPHPELPACGC